MKGIAILVFTLCSTLVNAQYEPIIHESNTWRGVVYGWGEFDYFGHFDGDTTINFQTYHKYYSGSTFDGMIYQSAIIREDVETQQVFRFDGVSDHLMYDFSAEQGDVLTVWGMGLEQEIEITSTEITMVGSDSRKKINFMDSWGPAYWIEGVGSSYGPMDPVLGPVADYSPVLTCFYQDAEVVWSNPINTDDCESLLVVGEMSQLEFEVWPNPFSDQFSILIPRRAFGRGLITVTEVTGKSIYRVALNSAGLRQVLIPDLSAGVYVITISLDGITGSKLLVRQS